MTGSLAKSAKWKRWKRLSLKRYVLTLVAVLGSLSEDSQWGFTHQQAVRCSRSPRRCNSCRTSYGTKRNYTCAIHRSKLRTPADFYRPVVGGSLFDYEPTWSVSSWQSQSVQWVYGYSGRDRDCRRLESSSLNCHRSSTKRSCPKAILDKLRECISG